jgi:hypothetical protein
LLKRRYKLHE